MSKSEDSPTDFTEVFIQCEALPILRTTVDLI